MALEGGELRRAAFICVNVTGNNESVSLRSAASSRRGSGFSS